MSAHAGASHVQGQHIMRHIGVVTSEEVEGGDDAKALYDVNFQPGDYLDVALLPGASVNGGVERGAEGRGFERGGDHGRRR